ncbi:glucose 1-dehydrogenase [Sphingomonas radiodurans]|uniref:glucose 1-dehydrogenase n=1 Tax=Sphingomonas radiodurans TaxID=2890321 RepID=UPI001E382593|nr:glucose 1-dehydrogenase [Sphingomonas radiodurans]WBH17799.1 glucose 1-dehydrogenase [Sphingomonas radiodurans]
MELAGKVALVTGAAAGLGAAAARRLAAEGAAVVVTDVDEATGRAVAESLDGLFVPHDVADEAAWARAIEETEARHGRLDILVNNAGITLMGSIEEMSLEGFRRTIDIDLIGTFLGCKAALPLMKRGGGGSIINIASISGLQASANLVAYNAAKAGVTLMSKSIAMHCATTRTGIRVNTIHPGVIRTAMLDKVMAQVPDPDALMAGFVAVHPIGHIGEPDDIAEMVFYLASDRSKFVTGAAMVVDGGATI